MEQMWAMALLIPFQTLAYITTKGVLRGGGDHPQNCAVYLAILYQKVDQTRKRGISLNQIGHPPSERPHESKKYPP